MADRNSRRVFISYRRSDTQGYAGWLHQILEEAYGRSNVFRDADSLEPGQHFPTRIARTIADCTEMFVLIGPGWLVPGPTGTPRLQDPDDWVRLELETAVQRGVPLVPFLVGSTPMPARAALPPSLYPLVDRQAHRLRDDHFQEDVRDAISRLGTVTRTGRSYLGTEQHNREKRFAELLELFTERAEAGSATIRSVPWRRAENLRPQLNAVVDVLEPDEDVADLVLCAWYDGRGEPAEGRAATAFDFVRAVGKGMLLGVLAVTPRRLIHAPRLSAASTSVVWIRDVVDVKIGITGAVTGDVRLILSEGDVSMTIRPNTRAGTIAGYVRDRIVRR